VICPPGCYVADRVLEIALLPAGEAVRALGRHAVRVTGGFSWSACHIASERRHDKMVVSPACAGSSKMANYRSAQRFELITSSLLLASLGLLGPPFGGVLKVLRFPPHLFASAARRAGVLPRASFAFGSFFKIPRIAAHRGDDNRHGHMFVFIPSQRSASPAGKRNLRGDPAAT